MKLTIFLFLISVISVFANKTYSQTKVLNLNIQNGTIKEALQNIEDQSGFYFMYSEKLVDVNREVSVNIKNQKINEVLDELFSGTDVCYKIKDRFILLTTSGEAGNELSVQPQVSVSGKVTDSSGAPLPGVTVVLKGTTTGTITDFDGNYTLANVPGDATLLFSFVGMKGEEIITSGKNRIDVTMYEESIGIEEVVAVGYGKQKKSHLTAAVDQVGGQIFENRPINSVGQGLQGVVAGLNVDVTSGEPEGSPKINIRGFTGFGTSSEPLILVDGIERDIADINPNDIASISVLKDGAASAIYGSRAPFGVVLIMTKEGNKGEKMKINYSANFRYGTPIGLPHFHNSYSWAEYVNEAYRNFSGGGGVPYFSELQIERMKAFAEGDFSNSVFDGLDPQEVRYGTYAFTPTQWGGHQQSFGNTDWFDLALKDVIPSQQHNVSVSGGSDKTTYYIGLGYNESEGIFKGPNFKNRYSSLVKVNTDITNWLTLNVHTNYVKANDKGPNLFGKGRDYSSIFDTFARSFPSWATTNPNGTYYRFNSLPNIIGDAGTVGTSRNDITLSGGAIIEPFKNLKIEGNYTWRNSSSNDNKTTLQLFQILPNGTQVINQRTVNNSAINKDFSNYDYHTIDIHASYSKTIKNVHNIYGLVGYQEEEAFFSQLSGSATNFYSQSIPSLSTSSANFNTSDNLYDWATQGIFGRFSYNFDEKYFIEFNFRHDATSRFRKSDRWGTFPSISGGWNIARENFWPVKDFVSHFKLRGSWSTSGDSNVEPGNYYLFSPTIGTGISDRIILNGVLTQTASQPALVSNELTWARPTSIDFGIDMSALKNRLEFNYDWYQRTIKDQFGPPASLPKTIGIAVPPTNNAVSETRGWEFNLKWKDSAFKILDKPFKYGIQFHMSDYIGYVVSYENDGTGAVNGQWTPGQIFGQNYQYISNGVAQNVQDLYANVPQAQGSANPWFYPGDLMYRDLNGDGEINGGTTGTWYSRGDLVRNGFDYPRKRYGITLDAGWNNFDLSVNLDGIGSWKKYASSKIQYIWGTDNNSVFYSPFFKETTDLGYWSPDNTDAFFPRNTLDSKNKKSPNDQYTLDLSHLRIRNITFGYNIPKSVLNKVKINKLYLYASAENLGFIYYNSWIKYDPQIISSSNGQGYPPQRVISFGINVEL